MLNKQILVSNTQPAIKTIYKVTVGVHYISGQPQAGFADTSFTYGQIQPNSFLGANIILFNVDYATIPPRFNFWLEGIIDEVNQPMVYIIRIDNKQGFAFEPWQLDPDIGLSMPLKQNSKMLKPEYIGNEIQFYLSTTPPPIRMGISLLGTFGTGKGVRAKLIASLRKEVRYA